jgi:hypothetical protein
MQGNLGYQYAMEEDDAGREFFNETDISFSNIYYSFPNSEYKSKFYKRGDDQESDVNEEDDSNDTSFATEFDSNFDQMFKPMDDTEEAIDMSQVYELEQSLSIVTEVSLNTTRFSNMFKGKESFKVNLTLPANFDMHTADAFNRTVELFYEQLIDEEGPLMRAIIGDNLGITQELIDAFGMRPPVISLKKSATNPTIYCDDPEIHASYGENDEATVAGLRKHLNEIQIDEIYASCKSSIHHGDEVKCMPDDEVCGATKCKFKRFILDSCSQKSNIITESVRILPRPLKFRSFPDNIPVNCNENINVSTANGQEEGGEGRSSLRFILPEINTGCRNVETNMLYEDEFFQDKCSHTIHRKWRAEMIGCENTLYVERTQKLYVFDHQAPQFIDFPQDRTIEFFQPYGTKEMQVPKVYDSCGHGPSDLYYTDSFKKGTI